MGYPRRFLGAEDGLDIDGVVIPSRCVVEVTFGCYQQRMLLRPDPETTEILLGCFGRALDRHKQLELFVLKILSNHGHFLCRAPNAAVLSAFMRDFLSTAARRLNHLRQRNGALWHRRYRAIPVLDDAAVEDRFGYILTQGTKENLVWSPRDWPGASSHHALLGGRPLVGRWRDLNGEAIQRQRRARKQQRAARRGQPLRLPPAEPLWRDYPIRHSPLPHWSRLPVGQQRARVAAILHQDETDTRARHERDRTRPLGVAGVLATDLDARPAEPQRSPAPQCHATFGRVRKAFGKAYKAFLAAAALVRDRAKQWLKRQPKPRDATLPPLPATPAKQSTGPPA